MIFRRTRRMFVSCVMLFTLGVSPSASTHTSAAARSPPSAIPTATGGSGARYKLLVHHDDAEREFAYGAESKIGTFSDSLMSEAKASNWTVVSMKNDWKQIFAWQN